MSLSISDSLTGNYYNNTAALGRASQTGWDAKAANGEDTASKALPGKEKEGSPAAPSDKEDGKVIVKRDNWGRPVEDEKDGRKNPEECQTCKNRKYQDGSDEMVSFKSAAHISPTAAATAVRAHEQEHVSNAYKKAASNNGKVINASVSLHTAICPECGRTYISGGTTHTQIKYYNEDNPYQQALKTADRAKYSGMNLDYAV